MIGKIILLFVLVFDVFISMKFIINLLLNKKYIVESIGEGKGLDGIQNIVSLDYQYSVFIILFNIIIIIIFSLYYLIKN